MHFRNFGRQEPGQPIKASTINRPIEAVEHLLRMRATAPASIKHTPAGPLFFAPQSIVRLAIANGNISARSGSAAGVGSVYLVSQQATFSDGAMTACTLTTSSVAIPVYNASSAKMTSGNGIDSGQYCLAIQDLSGFYCVWPLECS